jgi:hypothetical protein
MRNLIASKPLSLMPKTSELPFICSRLGEIRFSEPATIQPSIPRRDGEVTRSGYRTAARGICTADDGSRTFPRRGNCQEEWFRRSRADATVVRPGIRTVATGDSTHGKRVEGISGRPIRGRSGAQRRFTRRQTMVVSTITMTLSPMVVGNPFWGRPVVAGCYPAALEVPELVRDRGAGSYHLELAPPLKSAVASRV